MELNKLLKTAVERGASDVHFLPGMTPVIRIDGKIERSITESPIDEDLEKTLLNVSRKEIFNRIGDCDFAYSFLDEKLTYRFRVNAFKTSNGIAFAMRYIKREIPTLDELYMPTVLKHLTGKQHGLIAITGPTGSGKTTTLAAMLDLINQTYPYHIITIEDPIEFVHSSKKSIVNQREIGQDVVSFAAGLTAALRQNPNIIFVGEMRDRETVETALNAAETGHLVLTTLHTSSVIEAVDRILQYFKGNQQKQIQTQLANCFEAIIAQKLLLRSDGKGWVAAVEILTRNPATTNIIRNGEAYQLKNYMGIADGMQTMEAAINDLKLRNVL